MECLLYSVHTQDALNALPRGQALGCAQELCMDLFRDLFRDCK